jgi:hypothetical protein
MLMVQTAVLPKCSGMLRLSAPEFSLMAPRQGVRLYVAGQRPENKREVPNNQRGAPMIRHNWIPIVLCTLFVGGVASPSRAEQDRGACAQIIAACKNAGFVQGGASSGSGLQVDRVRPIMQGKAAKHKGRQALVPSPSAS